jgi:hypothetical protein
MASRRRKSCGCESSNAFKAKAPTNSEPEWRSARILVIASRRGDIPTEKVIRRADQSLLLVFEFLEVRFQLPDQPLAVFPGPFRLLLELGLDDQISVPLFVLRRIFQSPPACRFPGAVGAIAEDDRSGLQVANLTIWPGQHIIDRILSPRCPIRSSGLLLLPLRRHRFHGRLYLLWIAQVIPLQRL